MTFFSKWQGYLNKKFFETTVSEEGVTSNPFPFYGLSWLSLLSGSLLVRLLEMLPNQRVGCLKSDCLGN